VAVVKATKNRQDSDEATYDGGHYRKRRRDGDAITAVSSGCDVDNNTGTVSDENSDGDNDNDNDSDSNYWSGNDHDSDSSSIYSDDEDADTDDEFDAGPEETRAFLYRHFTISIVANEIPGKPNLVFMNATLLHTKGDGNHPRMWVVLASRQSP